MLTQGYPSKASLKVHDSTHLVVCLQVLLQLGVGQYQDFDVLSLMFGAAAKPGLSKLFCQAELQELMEIERQNQLVLLQTSSENDI